MKRLIVIVLWLVVIAVAVATWSGCRPEPPTPEPLPLPTAEAPTEYYTYYWPVVGKSWPSMPVSKQGIGLIYGIQPEPNYTSLSVWQAGGHWWHNWGPWAARGQSVAQIWATFVPTVWGGFNYEFVVLEDMCNRGFKGPVMFLNEPNHHSQANKTPSEAVELLKQLIDICPGVWIVGPRLSHEDWLHGFGWIKEFWELWQLEYGELPPVTPAIHGYFPASYWQKYLEDYRNLLKAYGWPKRTQIWVPEWNVPCSAGLTPEEQAMLFGEVLALLEESPLVEYHSPFALFMGRGYWRNLECAELIDENGSLTEIGVLYADKGRQPTTTAAYP